MLLSILFVIGCVVVSIVKWVLIIVITSYIAMLCLVIFYLVFTGREESFSEITAGDVAFLFVFYLSIIFNYVRKKYRKMKKKKNEKYRKMQKRETREEGRRVIPSH